MMGETIKKKINRQLALTKELSSSSLEEARDSAFLIVDHIMERVGMCVYYDENIKSTMPLKQKELILEKT